MSSSLFTCEHPVRVYNKYLGQYMYVPCRKCAMCKQKRASNWTRRLNLESKSHPYVFFGTLTYAPMYLPVLQVDWSGDGCLYDNKGTFYSLKELDLDDESKEFIRVRQCLPVFRSEDVQKFIKRLRQRVARNKSGEPKNRRYIRYFVAAEYGETLLRPHLHFIIWTRSKWFAENAKSVVAQCWTDKSDPKNPRPMGRVDCQAVLNSASSYVASYLTCDDNLPKVYTLRQFRPKSFFSKSPAIGTLQNLDEETRNLFYSGSVTRSVRNRKTNEVLDVLLEKSLFDRLYPRLGRFGEMAVDELYSVYGLADKVVGMDFNNFYFYALSLADSNRSMSSYFRSILVRNANSEHDMPLRSLLSTLKRFSINRQNYGISVRDYVDRIFEQVKGRDQYLLNFQLKWKETLSKNKDLRNFAWLMVDPTFLSEFLRYDFNNQNFNYHVSSALQVFSSLVSPDAQYEVYDPLRDQSYVDSLSLSKKAVQDGKNRHLKYEYLHEAEISQELKDFLIYFINKKVLSQYECK